MYANLQFSMSQCKDNTVVLSCTTAKDYHYNLEQLTKLHTEQLNTLQNTQWNGKTIKVFLFGDYACPPYLHILLGIVKKHHDLFENDLLELDLALANDPSVVTSLVPDNSPLYTYIQNFKNYQKLLAKLGFPEYQLSDDDSLTETEKRVPEQRVKLAQKEVPIVNQFWNYTMDLWFNKLNLP